jgi:fumarate reductase flavoprotein subunit
MTVLSPHDAKFEAEVAVAIIGAGACGLTAALSAQELTDDLLVVERDPVPAGSTEMSSGMIPASASRFQREAGIDDSPARMAADIMAKNDHQADPAVVDAVCRLSGPTVEWLVDTKDVPLALVQGFLYPGHSRHRMHAPPDLTGASLVGALTRAVEGLGVPILLGSAVTHLFADSDGTVRGLRLDRPGGETEDIGCRALVLACSGFAGNPDMVRAYIPEMADAEFHGHTGNKGDAVNWGLALGAAVRHMSAFQGHGSLAYPHRSLITWALMMEGGIQVNVRGERFSNEHQGYSEQALEVLRQPEGRAWDLFDDRLLELGRTFDDFRVAEAAGALKSGRTIDELAMEIGVPVATLKSTIDDCAQYAAGQRVDPFGRDFTTQPGLVPPYHAVRVTGALFHTQGGLVVDAKARVLREDGTALPNLFAGGGAACGVSGATVKGYLSGNGLLSAVLLGRLAGESAARQADLI